MPPRVLIALPGDTIQTRRILTGVLDVVGSRSWDLRLVDQLTWGAALPIPAELDGILGAFESDAEVARVQATGLPAVNLVHDPGRWALPAVEPDEEAAGALAAHHLLELGLPHFAVTEAETMLDWDRRRAAGFRRALAEHGVACQAIAVTGDPDRLGEALRRLARPCGIGAVRDRAGWCLTDAARSMGLRVPEDLAVVAIENDEFLCHLSDPALSSVAVAGEAVGRRGAELLEELMGGAGPPPGPVRLPPIGLVQRRSSQHLASADPAVDAALAYLHEHLAEVIGIPQLAAHVGLPRRTLEHRFRRTLGRSPNQELIALRLARAKQLLMQADRTIEAVAHACGFATASYLAALFRRQEGMSPATWRRQIGIGRG